MIDQLLVRVGLGVSVAALVASIGAMAGVYHVEPSWLMIFLLSLGALTIASDAYLLEYQRRDEAE